MPATHPFSGGAGALFPCSNGGATQPPVHERDPMEPHVIDLERLDGMADGGTQLEIQGSFSIRKDPNPLEGVHQSKLRMSRKDAIKLYGYLKRALGQP